jgi:hypothetical protein
MVYVGLGTDFFTLRGFERIGMFWVRAFVYHHIYNYICVCACVAMLFLYVSVVFFTLQDLGYVILFWAPCSQTSKQDIDNPPPFHGFVSFSGHFGASPLGTCKKGDLVTYLLASTCDNLDL